VAPMPASADAGPAKAVTALTVTEPPKAPGKPAGREADKPAK